MRTLHSPNPSGVATPAADARSAAPGLSLLAAADLQDDLMTATHDLDRLQALLAHACDELLESFRGAHEHLRAVKGTHAADQALDAAGFDAVARRLGGAVTALQFQDMASQLITHTHKRLRSCADRIAREAMGDDEDGAAVVEDTPQRPNPVTQDEMDAGSVELFHRP